MVIQRKSLSKENRFIHVGITHWATESNRFQPKEGNIEMEIKIVSNEWLETDEFGALHL